MVGLSYQSKSLVHFELIYCKFYSVTTHRKKKMLKRSAPSEDESDLSDFEKGIVKGSRTSTPISPGH